MFLRDYIDRIFTESAKVPKKRNRLQANTFYEKERTAPFQALNWTIRGYNGSLKNAIKNAFAPQNHPPEPILPKQIYANNVPQLKYLPKPIPILPKQIYANNVRQHKNPPESDLPTQPEPILPTQIYANHVPQLKNPSNNNPHKNPPNNNLHKNLPTYNYRHKILPIYH